MPAVSDSDLNEIQCRLIKAQLPAWNRIKTALAEAQKPSPNKTSKSASQIAAEMEASLNGPFWFTVSSQHRDCIRRWARQLLTL